jgi:hypothetical protein
MTFVIPPILINNHPVSATVTVAKNDFMICSKTTAGHFDLFASAFSGPCISVSLFCQKQEIGYPSLSDTRNVIESCAHDHTPNRVWIEEF